MVKTDSEMWEYCHPDDLWVFDKAIVAKKLGYKCGPKGVSVPHVDHYIVRPVMNTLGMGRGAYFAMLAGSTDNVLPDGTFWCEIFEGRHLSVDYQAGEQVLCVEGFREETCNLNRWSKWEKVEDKVGYPEICKTLKGEYNTVNVEFIGDKIVEIHLRGNPDFADHDAHYIIPSYGETILLCHEFISDNENERIGYFIPKPLRFDKK